MMKKVAFVIVFVAISSSSIKAAPPQHGKIVGGLPASPQQFPYHIELTWWANYFCGGAIIAPDWIITAAHCAIQEAVSYAAVANQSNILLPEQEVVRRVSKVFQHPNYNHGHGYAYDIALMKLVTPFEFGDGVQPIALPPANHTPPAGESATITGWGAMLEDGLSSNILRWVEVPTVDRAVCRQAYESYGLPVTDFMNCAGLLEEGGKDSCSGDSGGPVVAQDLGYQYLLGIVSWSIGCARPGLPGVNTDVPYFIDWIEKTMSEN